MSNNFYLKILAIISAIFLWFFVINEGFRIDNLDTEIPIEVKNLSEDLIIVNDLPKVKLKLRAPTDIWQQEIADNLNASINLMYYKQGEYNVEVKVEATDKNIQVIQQDPKNVDVVLAPILSIEKEITLEASGNLAENYQAGEPKFSPEQIRVQGAKIILDQVDKIIAPINFNGETSEIRKIVQLQAKDKNNNIINKVNILPGEVEVIIPISKESGEKTVGVRANTYGTLPANTSIEKIEVNPSTVVIKGKTADIDKIDTIQTQGINLSELTEDVNILKINLDLPKDIEVKDNPQITVTIYLNQQEISKQFSGIIKYKNLADNLKVGGIMPSRIQLTLFGPSAKINSLNEEDVYTEVDLTGKSEGTYEFNIYPENIVVPPSISVKSVETKIIKVIVVKK